MQLMYLLYSHCCAFRCSKSTPENGIFPYKFESITVQLGGQSMSTKSSMVFDFYDHF